MWTIILAVALVGVPLMLWLLSRRSNRGKHNDSYLKEKFTVKDGITFFDNSNSPCARRVRITLYEKEIKHSVVDVDLIARENRHPSYLAINPLGKVPALVVRNMEGVPDCCLFESNAITEWLDEQFPKTVQLYPSGVWERCQVKMWQQWEMAMAEDFWPMLYSNTLGFVYRALYSRSSIAKRVSKGDPYQAAKMMKTYDDELLTARQRRDTGIRLFRRLDLLEKALVGKMYICGNSFSSADISVLPRLALFPLIGFLTTEYEHSRYPNVFRYMKCLAFRKSIVDSDHSQKLLKLSRWLPWSVILWIGNRRSGLKSYRMYGKDLLLQIGKIKNGGSIPPQPPSKGYEIVLYHHSLCPASIMTYIACLEFGLKTEIREVNTIVLEQRSPKYLAVNPNGEIPSVFHDGRVVYDPLNIIEYLNAFFSYLSGKTFLPDSPPDLVRMRMWQGWVNTCYNYQLVHLCKHYIIMPILKSQFPSTKSLLEVTNKSTTCSEYTGDMLSMFMSTISSDEIESKMSPYKQGLEKALEYLEQELIGRQYLVGSKLSPGDMSVFSLLVLFKWVRIPISRSKFPNIVAWMKRMSSLPSFSVVENEVESYMMSHGIQP